MELTTKIAKELKIWKDNLNFNNKLRIDVIINFKNELKEIIKLPLAKEHIELLIQEIESVEK